jgi:hypothetical protein
MLKACLGLSLTLPQLGCWWTAYHQTQRAVNEKRQILGAGRVRAGGRHISNFETVSVQYITFQPVPALPGFQGGMDGSEFE